MSSIGTGYDLSAPQILPDGRVFQVKYAFKAIKNSGTAIVLCGSDGVVFAVVRLVKSKLYEDCTGKRLFSVEDHIGMAVGGSTADASAILNVAREEARSYRQNYSMPISLEYLNERVSEYLRIHTLYSYIRPFGCTVIIGSYDPQDGPQMYMIDPAGVSFGYFGCAIGEAKQTAQTEIEKLNLNTMTCKELIKEAVKIIYMVHDELKDKQFELELSWVGSHTNGKHEEVSKEVFDDALKYAKASLDDNSGSDGE
ncbi:proteasome subunit alpha type-3-like [Acyrthosiphon pisum]|uniref:Proteasome alpha-type subunits domain-containing protein n=1 Tax=Acyrthosiphon pisum TaxID=7029 RepID=A0A8R1ZZM3_ACYPI|nr:proteasome subunit alpha type-3-like [Acyrthosiphon pisum]|eukprot:XP_001945150.1 PREDICTED: proteasome subunit alpha type-3-like [Acyrthosiphon pisum]